MAKTSFLFSARGARAFSLSALALLFAVGSFAAPAGNFYGGVRPLRISTPEDSHFEAFSAIVNANSVSFVYDFSFSESRLQGKGKAVLQGESFLTEGNGVKIYSNGKSRWFADYSIKEVVVESVSNELPDLLSNPVTVFSAASKSLKLAAASKEGGLAKLTLLPLGKGTGLLSAILYFDSGSLPVKGSLNMEDGEKISFNIEKVKISPKLPKSAFELDTASLGDAWVVTDLR